MNVIHSRLSVLAGLVLLCTLAVSCGRGPDDPIHSAPPVEKTKTFDDFREETFSGSECGNIARKIFVTDHELVQFESLPFGTFEYRGGVFFVSSKLMGNGLSQAIVVDPDVLYPEIANKECLSHFSYHKSSHLGGLPKGFTKKDAGDFSARTKRNFLYALSYGHGQFKVFDSELDSKSSLQFLVGTGYAYQGGVKFEHLKIYKLDEATFKLVQYSVFHNENDLVSEWSAGLYKWSPPVLTNTSAP